MNVFVIQVPNFAYLHMGKAQGYKAMPLGEHREYVMPVRMVLCLYCE
jgi:hypothetical protein